MYYEYHLNNGTIEVSDTANISSFSKYVGEYEDEDGCLRDHADIGVVYCMICRGDKPLTLEEEEDMWDRMADMN